MRTPTSPGDYAAAAADSPLQDAIAQLRLLNGDYPAGDAQGGRRIKLVRRQ